MFVKSASAEDWDLIVVNSVSVRAKGHGNMNEERTNIKFNIVVTSCLIDDEFTQGQCRKGSPRGARFMWDLSLGSEG